MDIFDLEALLDKDRVTGLGIAVYAIVTLVFLVPQIIRARKEWLETRQGTRHLHDEKLRLEIVKLRYEISRLKRGSPDGEGAESAQSGAVVPEMSGAEGPSQEINASEGAAQQDVAAQPAEPKPPDHTQTVKMWPWVERLARRHVVAARLALFVARGFILLFAAPAAGFALMGLMFAFDPGERTLGMTVAGFFTFCLIPLALGFRQASRQAVALRHQSQAENGITTTNGALGSIDEEPPDAGTDSQPGGVRDGSGGEL